MIESIGKNTMNISVKKLDALHFACDALVLPLREDKGILPYSDIDKTLSGLLTQIVSSGEFAGKLGQTSLIHTQGKIKPDRILLIGLGKSNKVTKETLRQAGGKSSAFLRNLSIRNIALSSKAISSSKISPADFMEGLLLSEYSFRKYKKVDNKNLNSLTILSSLELKKKIKWIETIANATNLARDLVNTPANDMPPHNACKVCPFPEKCFS
jgi:leucyl aminopeptidase